ncbi:MFS transporter [Paraferrimonas sp. SM1919]|uniref:MFS transporter n=1 Tax=Paraferrimonas sp. SM1919 TaxID=2662263 RepID=UPI0013D2DB5F|nr:MFS transporter [Paraferrimonas sp. SM1919]
MSRSYATVVLVMLTFFVISFITNILGTLNPLVAESFNLGPATTGLLALFFFFAYGVFSMPGGMLYEKFGSKTMMAAAFVVSGLGGLLVAIAPSFVTFAISLFLIGSGMALLQVVINPMLRTAGGEENFAFFSVAAQLAFGAASFVAPLVFQNLVINIQQGTAEGAFLSSVTAMIPRVDLAWLSMYWLFAVVAIAMLVIVMLFKFQKVTLAEDEKSGTVKQYIAMFKDKTILAFFFGIFCYVGTEQGVSFWISQFLVDYHGLDAVNDTPAVLSNFWLYMTIGCFFGLVLLKVLDSKIVLRVFTIATMVALVAALTGDAEIAVMAFPFVGFFISVMWSIIFSLALNSVNAHHGAFAGVLCTGIIGGALFPPVVGFIAELSNLKVGLFFMLVPMAYILSISFWAKPLISNKTIFDKEPATEQA